LTGLYNNLTEAVDNKYAQHVSPAGIIFGVIWPIIYIWNLAGAVYMIVALCLPERISPVKMHPTLVSKVGADI